MRSICSSVRSMPLPLDGCETLGAGSDFGAVKGSSSAAGLSVGAAHAGAVGTEGSPHGDGADSIEGAFGGSGAGGAAGFCRSSKLNFGNARVSPLNDSADGDAPNGDSVSAAGVGGADGCDVRC